MKNKEIGLTVGRFQPPHRGHIEIIKEILSAKYIDLLYIFITGNKHSIDNPLDFETRSNIILSCLTDSEKKRVKLVKAKDGLIPNLVKENVPDYDKALGIHLIVGRDRADDFIDQIERFNMDDIIDVNWIDDVKYNGYRISGTMLRESIIKGSKSFIQQLLYQDFKPKAFDIFYNKMRREIGRFTKLEGDTTEQLKSIKHLKDLKYDEFVKWITEIIYWTSVGENVEASEKLDGSAQISFGIKAGKFYTSPKANEIHYDADSYQHESHKKAHQVLEKLEPWIRCIVLNPDKKGGFIIERHPPDKIPEEAIYPQYFTEVLYTKIPNVIEYGSNRLVFYKVSVNGFHLPDLESKVIDALFLPGTIPKFKIIDGERWYFSRKPIVDKDMFNNLLRSYDAPLYNATVFIALESQGKVDEDRRQKIKEYTYNGIVEKVVKKLTPKFGAAGSFIEGIVLKDVKTGDMVKVTDDETFGETSRRYWKYRDQLNKQLEPELYKDIALLTGVKSLFRRHLGTAHIAKKIQEHKLVETAGEFKSTNTYLDSLLLRYIYKEALFSGIEDKNDAVGVVIAHLHDHLQAVLTLYDEWSKDKKEALPDLIIERTEKEFMEHIERYSNLMKKFSKFQKSKMTNDFKLVSILKHLTDKNKLMSK
jgi:hypothetical protein